MKNENEARVPSPGVPVATPLTVEQTDQVAGGRLVVTGPLGGGCRTCTSGLPTAFSSLAAAVNPAS